MWKFISAYFITAVSSVTGTPPGEISWNLFFLRNNRFPKVDPGPVFDKSAGSIGRRKIFLNTAMLCGVALGLYGLFLVSRYWTVTATIDDIWQQQNIAAQVSKQREAAGILPTAEEALDDFTRPPYLEKYGIGPVREFLDPKGYFVVTGTNWNAWGFSTKVAAVLWLAPPKVKPKPLRIWKEVDIVDEYFARNPPTANLVAVIAGAETATAESR